MFVENIDTTTNPTPPPEPEQYIGRVTLSRLVTLYYRALQQDPSSDERAAIYRDHRALFVERYGEDALFELLGTVT